MGLYLVLRANLWGQMVLQDEGQCSGGGGLGREDDIHNKEGQG